MLSAWKGQPAQPADAGGRLADRQGPQDPPGQPGHLRGAQDPRRAAPGPGRPLEPQAGRPADAPGGRGRPADPPAPPEHPPRPHRDRRARPGGPRLHRRPAQRVVDGRLHRAGNRRGGAVPVGTAGWLLAGVCGLVDASRPPRVAALRRSSLEMVDADRPSRRAISRPPTSWARRMATSSRSANDR